MSQPIGQKILIIEDEALVARELKSRLTQMGCEVVGIAFGSESIEMARKTSPDLLLTDIHLKDGQDGIEIARAIKSERDVPVVFLTAYTDDETVSRAKAVAPYGYVIKPVEVRELQIVIEMALYKFSIEKELRETQQLLQTALTCIGSALVFVNQMGKITDLNADAEKILGTTKAASVGRTWTDAFTLIGTSIQNKINKALASNEVVKLAPFINNAVISRPNLLDGIVGPMENGGVLILRALSEISDPIEPMPSADELLREGIGSERLIPSESSMCQLLIAQQPDAEREQVEGISQLLNQQLRSTDLVSVYANSQLSVSMPYTSVSEGRLIANSILRQLKSHFSGNGAEFSIGLSYSSPGDQQPIELFRRASWGLRVAQDSGGGRVIVWNDEVETPSASSETDKQREYQNLVLLWNVLNVVATTADLEGANHKLCSHLLRSFDLAKIAIVSASKDQTISVDAGAITNKDEFSGITDLGLSQLDFEAMQQILASQTHHLGEGKRHLFKLNQEKLVLVEAKVDLETRDVEFLKSLLAYFAAGLNRFDLPETAKRGDSGEGELLFQSRRMSGVIESIKLVADTDATVLVAGESGTGKELIARRIHANSSRKDKAFIIVDCGAVVRSLIESELFGHEKGAFTGAEKQFSGRLKEADGGTVLLDEIGELPLEVQVKLLRYVQDREIAAVGSSQYETVDTRIIAATNRDLKLLVESGDFREDLYYRLNVFTIDSPPLRERPDDIMLLANHYLAVYGAQYNKDVRGFSEDAEQALLQYAWPGNIRELTNVVNRAVILCKDSTLSTIHLGLFPEKESITRPNVSQVQEISIAEWIKGLVDLCLSRDETIPLAHWLEEDLVSHSIHVNNDVLNRAALELRIPESTLRRKVSKMRHNYHGQIPFRPDSWRQATILMSEVFKIATAQKEPLFEVISTVLIRELESRHLNKKLAASLMGVSLPTYRRMAAEAS